LGVAVTLWLSLRSTSAKAMTPSAVITPSSTAAPADTAEVMVGASLAPVIVTVTVGTLTFYDSKCGTWDLAVGHSYVESPGQVLNAKVLPDKNTGIANVEWFTTRIYPAAGTDPIVVPAPCSPS
jgi:hypothetical protein